MQRAGVTASITSVELVFKTGTVLCGWEEFVCIVVMLHTSCPHGNRLQVVQQGELCDSMILTLVRAMRHTRRTDNETGSCVCAG